MEGTGESKEVCSPCSTPLHSETPSLSGSLSQKQTYKPKDGEARLDISNPSFLFLGRYLLYIRPYVLHFVTNPQPASSSREDVFSQSLFIQVRLSLRKVPELASGLSQVTTHWLRHKSCRRSHDLSTIPNIYSKEFPQLDSGTQPRLDNPSLQRKNTPLLK
jgi:hypothetical protein